MCQIDLVHLMSYIVYWYEPSDLAYEISHLIWHMRFTAIWGNRSTVDPIVLPDKDYYETILLITTLVSPVIVRAGVPG